jgi:glutamyl-tRNA reductase
MHIVVVGASHASAPVSLLERLNVSPADMDSALSQLRTMVAEALILSTCNRTEIYAAVAGTGEAELLLRWLAARAGQETLGAHAYAHAGDAAVRHALRVASGLDSMALGEEQIQAQVRRALNAARAMETLGTHLERLGAAALGCGKRVRAFTGLGRDALSLESIAVDTALARATSRRSILVIGSGSSASVLLRRLRDADVGEVTVVGRTSARARSLADSVGARFAPWETLSDALVAANVVFCCTSAPHPVLTTDVLARRRTSTADPLVCVDLGMPRDVEPDVANMERVTLIGLDTLGREAAARRSHREEHVSAAEAIVERETSRFVEWLGTRDRTGDIIRARAHADDVAEEELRRALARMPNLSTRERTLVAGMARRIARRLAHGHTEAIKRPEIALLAEQA